MQSIIVIVYIIFLCEYITDELDKSLLSGLSLGLLDVSFR